MLRVLLRKLALLIVLVPLLHAGGYIYALRYQPPLIVNYRTRPPTVTLGQSPPFWASYRAYWRAAQQGDWGKIERTPLIRLMPRFLQRSLLLASVALLVTIGLGPLLGLLSISRQTGRIGPSALTIFTLGTAIPGFFLGTTLIVILLAMSRRSWFGLTEVPVPVQGYGADSHLVLPVLALAIRPVMYVAYVMAGLLEGEFQQDYIRVARSKGLRWARIVRSHALPNIAAPVISALGRALQMIIGGMVLVETLFDWRGAGWLFTQVIIGHGEAYYSNPPLVGLLIAFFGFQLILIDLLASVLAVAADPRLRHGSARLSQ